MNLSEYKGQNLKNIFYGILLFLAFLFAIFLRIKVYAANPSMWNDECALAWSVLHKNYADFFSKIEYSQVAPPLFMVFAKIATAIFGANDFAVRLIPFLAGILSIPLFYLVAKESFKRKFTVLLALFLFAVNQQLINYSFEFKQYGVDVFCTLACLYFFQKLDIEKISIKKLLVWAVGLALTIWLSFVSVFTIAGGFAVLLFTDFKKNISKKATLMLPLALSLIFYLVFYLAPTHAGPFMANYWAGKFIKPDFSNFLYLLVENIKYFFFPIKMVLFAFILLVWGLIWGVKDKNKTILISFVSLLLLVVASVLQIYPFFDRLILFMLPLFLIWALVPVDGISTASKIKSGFAVLLTALAFYVQIPSTIQFSKLSNFSRGEFPREMMKYMAENIKPTDTVFVNSASGIEFDYYSTFSPVKNKIIRENVTNESSQKYIEFLNTLPSGNYWFYLPYDSSHRPVFSLLSKWLSTKKINTYLPKGKSVLIYVYID